MAELPSDCDHTTPDLLPVVFTLILGALFGSSLAFLTPPFDAPEEWQHFFRSYQCSEAVVYAWKESVQPGGELPASLSEVSGAIQDGIRNEFGFHVSLEKLKTVATIPLDPERRKFAEFPAAARFSPVPYLPAAAAMWITRGPKSTALGELYIARIGTLTAYLLLAATAVWVMPVQKWLMSLVALMPMSMFLAASVSADALSIGFSLLSIAMIVRLALRDGPVSRGDLAWLGTVLLLLALVKPAYVLIAFLVFMVPEEKLGGQRQCWRMRAGFIAIPLAASFLWLLSVRGLYVPLRPGVDPPGQVRWIVAHPVYFCKHVLDRITDVWLYSGVIATLGWGTLWLASYVYYVYWFALLAAAALDGSGQDFRVSRHQRAVAFAVYLLVLFAIGTLTYLMWHRVGDNPIHGVQSRYFVPVLPLLLLPLRAKASRASSKFAQRLVPAVAIVAVLIGVGATWQAEIARYYWR